MSFYRINGKEANRLLGIGGTLFGTDGNLVDAFYGIDGSRYEKSGIGTLKAMSYNVQSWSQLNREYRLVNPTFSNYKPDVIGFQEYCVYPKMHMTPNSLGTVTSTDFIKMHADYLEEASGFALASKYEMASAEIVYFEKASYQRYQKAYITVGGKQIAVYNVHFTYESDSIEKRCAEAQELFEIVSASDDEYFIIIGDINTHNCVDTESETYTRMLKWFVDGGYIVANRPSGPREYKYTHTTGLNTYAGKFLSGGTTPAVWNRLDNVITSSNIDITQFDVDMRKAEDYRADDPNWWKNQKVDHFPVIAHLTVNEYTKTVAANNITI